MPRKKPVRRYYTFTELLYKAQELKRSNHGQYEELTSYRGTECLVSGLRIRMHRNIQNSTDSFSIVSRKTGNAYCTMHGTVVDGNCYTTYHPSFSTSKYEKNLHPFLPWELPRGVKLEKSTPFVAYHQDGSVAVRDNVGWWGNYRGEYGRYMTGGSFGSMTVRDIDGQFLSPLPETLRGGGLTRAFPVSEALGIAFDAVEPRQWFDSMVSPLWDGNRVRLLAIKAYKQALRIVADNPHMKIALYPAKEVVVGETYRPHQIGRSNSKSHVVARDLQGEPVIYRLPQLCLYWVPVHSKYPRSVLNYIYVAIPPHGCPLLELDKPEIPTGKIIRQGPRAMGTVVYNNCLGRGELLERVAYTFSPKFKKLNWQASRDCVKVTSVLGDNTNTNQAVVGADDCFNVLEERALMSSLPLC